MDVRGQVKILSSRHIHVYPSASQDVLGFDANDGARLLKAGRVSCPGLEVCDSERRTVKDR